MVTCGKSLTAGNYLVCPGPQYLFVEPIIVKKEQWARS